MRVVKSLVLAIVLLLAASLVAAEAPKWHELQGYSFDRFEGDFNRRYSTADERAFRRQVFERRLARIQEHNANPHRTYNKGVNHFADWTEQEFKAYNTASPRYAERFFASAAESSAPQLPFYQYNATGALTPRSVDYRLASPPVLTGVKNQVACGSCWAHSTVETIESMFAIRFGQLPVLSQQQVSACTAMMDGCGGGTYWYGWQYVSQSGGLNEEWLYPYTDFFAKNESKAATAACRNITADFLPNFSWLPKANVSAMNIVDPNNATALMEALAFKGPISIAVGASDWSDYEGGIFLNPFNSSVPFEIDHAVQAVGYGYDTTVDLGYWIVRNSWGTSWGESGFIRLYRPTSGAPEPCSNVTGQLTCGTSGILFQPGYPTVTMLAKKNL